MQPLIFADDKLLTEFFRQIVTWIPKLLGAFVILLIGYIIARAVAKIINRALTGAKLDKRLHAGTGGNVIQRAVPSPTNLISNISFWIVYLGAISLGVGTLGIPLLTDLIRGFYSFLPNIIVAIIIFLIASGLSVGVAGFVSNVMGDTPTGKIVAGVAPTIIMGLAVFMILSQLRIAPAIVNLTYAALVGSVALGSAIAFGLGGRDMAARILNDAYNNAQSNKSQIMAEARRGKSRAKRVARHVSSRPAQNS